MSIYSLTLQDSNNSSFKTIHLSPFSDMSFTSPRKLFLAKHCNKSAKFLCSFPASLLLMPCHCATAHRGSPVVASHLDSKWYLEPSTLFVLCHRPYPLLINSLIQKKKIKTWIEWFLSGSSVSVLRYCYSALLLRCYYFSRKETCSLIFSKICHWRDKQKADCFVSYLWVVFCKKFRFHYLSS